ncbi:MAG: ankyrin repeat domain-containing protein [Armatimonadota bacterium]
MIDYDRSFVTYRNPHANCSTPLHLAASNGYPEEYPEIVRILIINGADVNAQDDRHMETPLYLAAECGYIETVKLLLDYGADVTIQNVNGKTALFASTDPFSRHPKDVQSLLLKAGAGDVMTVFDAVRIGDLARVTQMLDTDPGLIAVIDSGYRDSTLLHHAAETGQVAVAKYLLEKGADINATDRWGWTPLGLAIEFSDSPEMISLLELHNAVEPSNPGYPINNEDAAREWPRGS